MFIILLKIIANHAEIERNTRKIKTNWQNSTK